MTARIGTMSIDGTPISEADLARIEAEEQLHADQQRGAVRVVAASAIDADDCRTLLSILGLDRQIVAEARAQMGNPAPPKRPRRRRAACPLSAAPPGARAGRRCPSTPATKRCPSPGRPSSYLPISRSWVMRCRATSE